MFQDDELLMSEQDLALLNQLEQLDEVGDALHAQLLVKRTLDVQLLVKLDEDHTLVLLVKAPLTPDSDYKGPIVNLIRPAFLERQAYDQLLAELPTTGEDVAMESVEYLKDQGPQYLNNQAQTTIDNDIEHGQTLVRIWFYLPSLSTRAKRLDLCRLAPQYDLTGFVLAGKPGVLCLEGDPRQAQAYMADIKCNSWSDIPSFQKKISERLREDDIASRQFKDMTEITDTIARHGQRGNRGDLGQVEAFLKEHSLGHVFSYVFMQQL
jgi:hypothetical protein